MHESWLYNPTISTELTILIIFPLIPEFLLSFLYPSFCRLYTNIWYG